MGVSKPAVLALVAILVATGAGALIASSDVIIGGVVVAEGRYSKQESRSVEVIEDADALKAFWARAGEPSSEPPLIDFARGPLVAALYGSHPNTCAGSARVYALDSRVVVRFEPAHEGSWGCASTVTAPYKIVQIHTSKRPLVTVLGG